MIEPSRAWWRGDADKPMTLHHAQALADDGSIYIVIDGDAGHSFAQFTIYETKYHTKLRNGLLDEPLDDAVYC